MSYEFTVDEIKEIVRAARIFCPGFSEEQLQHLVESEERLAESGYLDAVAGLAQLEKEKGICCTEALDAYKELLSDKEHLEAEIASLQEKLTAQQNTNQRAGDRYQEMTKEIGQARAELDAVQKEHRNEQRELVSFRKKAEKEKQCIDKEVNECRDRANVTKEDIVAAGKLKAEVEIRGFDLGLALDLCQEFAGYKNARNDLSRALKEHRTLSKYVTTLSKQGEEQKKALTLKLDELQARRDSWQAKVDSLEQTHQQLRGILSQLQADVVHEEELRRFYSRYYGREGLLECLASWDQIFFVRCNHPLPALAGVFDRSAAAAHFWTDKPATRCPHCGLTMLISDEKPYHALNWPVGSPLKLQLGE